MASQSRRMQGPMGESSQRLSAVLWAGVVRKVRSKSVVGRVSFIFVGGLGSWLG
jgi:hypothetical protein